MIALLTPEAVTDNKKPQMLRQQTAAIVDGIRPNKNRRLPWGKYLRLYWRDAIGSTNALQDGDFPWSDYHRVDHFEIPHLYAVNAR